MPFSLSLSSYLLDASTCFDREASTVAQVISFTISAVCLSFTKQKQTKKNLVSSTKKRNKLAQASQNSMVYHEASTFGTEALMSKNNNSLSSHKSETQVVQD